MLTARREEFEKNGIIALKSFAPRRTIEMARKRLIDDLGRLAFFQDGKWQSKKFEGLPAFQVSNRIAQKLSHFAEYDDVLPKNFEVELSTLCPEAHRFARTPIQLLVTPPQKEEWALPTLGWHIDVATRDRLPGIQIFILLDDLAPQGGATMALVGSHFDRGLKPLESNVLEMHGKAGDAFLMDMRMLHAPSINARKKARLMLTSRFMLS